MSKNELKELVNHILKQLSNAGQKIQISENFFSKYSTMFPDLKFVAIPYDESDSDDSDSDDDDEVEGPPPPSGGLDMDVMTPVFSEKDTEFLKGKIWDNDKINIMKIPKNKYQGSVFSQKHLFESSGAYFKSDTIDRVLFKHFNKEKRDEMGQKKGDDDENEEEKMEGDDKTTGDNNKKKKNEKGKKKKKKKQEFLIEGKKTLITSIALRGINLEMFLKAFSRFEPIDKGEFFRVFELFQSFKEEDFNDVYGFGASKKKKSNLNREDCFILDLFERIGREKIREWFKCYEIRFTHEEILVELNQKFSKLLIVSSLLKDNQNFANFLGFILGISNFLNSENGENVIYGINIRSLSGLAKIYSRVRNNESLLDLIYRIIKHKKPEMLEFIKEFEIVKEIAGNKLSEKKREMDELCKNLERVEKFYNQEIKKKILKVKLRKNFENLMKACITKVKIGVHSLEQLYEEILEKYRECAVYYAQTFEQMDDFFVDLSEFLKLFEESERKILKREKRRIKRNKFDTITKKNKKKLNEKMEEKEENGENKMSEQSDEKGDDDNDNMDNNKKDTEENKEVKCEDSNINIEEEKKENGMEENKKDKEDNIENNTENNKEDNIENNIENKSEDNTKNKIENKVEDIKQNTDNNENINNINNIENGESENKIKNNIIENNESTNTENNENKKERGFVIVKGEKNNNEEDNENVNANNEKDDHTIEKSNSRRKFENLVSRKKVREFFYTYNKNQWSKSFEEQLIKHKEKEMRNGIKMSSKRKRKYSKIFEKFGKKNWSKRIKGKVFVNKKENLEILIMDNKYLLVLKENDNLEEFSLKNIKICKTKKTTITVKDKTKVKSVMKFYFHKEEDLSKFQSFLPK